MPYKRARENYLAIASHFLVFLAFFAAMVGEDGTISHETKDIANLNDHWGKDFSYNLNE